MAWMYSNTDLANVCRLEIDSVTQCGRAWADAHVGSYAYGDGTQFVAPYFDIPLGLQDVGMAQYIPFPNIARPEPALKFMGVDNRRLRVVFHLIAEDATYSVGALKRAVSWLSDLNQTTPKVDGNGRFAPPRVTLTVGQVFSMPCVVEQCGVQWVGPWSDNLADPASPQRVDVTVGFVSVPRSFVNYGSVSFAARTSVG